MGHIIHLPLSTAAIPGTLATLGAAECALISAIRSWCADVRQNRDPLPRLLQAMTDTGAPEAALALDHLMAVATRSAPPLGAIHPPRCPDLSPEETTLLNAADLAQAGQAALAQHALRIALLSAPDAACALVPLLVLGEAFAEAGLFFRRSRTFLAALSTARP